MNGSWSRAIGFAAVTALICAINAGTASADTGQLTPQGCFEDTEEAPTSCGGNQNQGLAGAHALAISPDGRSLYATGLNDSAISMFSRDPATGGLTPMGCVMDDEVNIGCADNQQVGIQGPFGIAVSPDGLSVYVVAGQPGDHSLARFDRDPVTGDLDERGCISASETGPADPAGCGVTQYGLGAARSVVVSPDGSAVYVSSGNNAVIRFPRTTTGDVGAIAPGSCVTDPPAVVACGNLTAEGLGDAYGLAISPDGTSLYVAARADGAVTGLSSTLSPLGCFSDVDTPIAGCTNVQGLAGGRGIAVSPDGKSVYSVGGSGAIVSFDRQPGGTLTPAGCVSDTEISIGCGGSAQGLGNMDGVAVSPDNASVYTVGRDDAIVRLDRNPASGALTPRGCIFSTGITGCDSTTSTLVEGRQVVVSPDGKSVYMTAFGDSALTAFARESGTDLPPAIPPSNVIAVRTKKLSCKDKCKKVTVKVDVDGPGKVVFCNAPANVHAPCGIAGDGPTPPSRVVHAKKTKAITDKAVDVAAAGTVTASLKVTKKASKTIAKKDKLSFTLQVDFTPTGGTVGSDRQKLKIKRKE